MPPMMIVARTAKPQVSSRLLPQKSIRVKYPSIPKKWDSFSPPSSASWIPVSPAFPPRPLRIWHWRVSAGEFGPAKLSDVCSGFNCQLTSQDTYHDEKCSGLNEKCGLKDAWWYNC